MAWMGLATVTIYVAQNRLQFHYALKDGDTLTGML